MLGRQDGLARAGCASEARRLLVGERRERDRRARSACRRPSRAGARAAPAARCRRRAAARRVAQSTRWSTKSSRPSSAQCRSSKTSTSGRSLGERLEEAAPGGEGLVAAVAAGSSSPVEPDERPQVASRPSRASVVGDESRDRLAELRLGRLGGVGLEDAGLRLDHLAERPEGDALAVGQRAALPPVDDQLRVARRPPATSSQTSRLLPMPGHADERDELRRRARAARARARRASSVELLARGRRAARAPRWRRRRRARARASTASQTGTGSALPFASTGSALAVLDRVLASRGTSSRRRGCRSTGAADCRRAAVLTTSPATIPSPASGRAPSATSASPVLTADPHLELEPGRSFSSDASRIASAARTARSGSSSCATGAPKSAMTASPMNFSTVPPKRSSSARSARVVRARASRARPRGRAARPAR